MHQILLSKTIRLTLAKLVTAKNFICKRSHFMVKTGFKELKNVQMTENRVPGVGNFFFIDHVIQWVTKWKNKFIK